jgi:hypothetical protein
MKKFKITDTWISAILILYYGLIAIPLRFSFSGLALIEGYFVVGGWQCVSMTVHMVTGYFNRGWGIRSIYHWTSLILLLTMPVGSIWILVFIAPLMAVFYTYMCYQETFIKMRRPMELLK